jgi:hypothetical protein
MQVLQTEQRFTINPTYICSTPVFTGMHRKKSVLQRRNEQNLLNNSHNGKLSVKAISRLRNAVNWLCESAQWKPLYWKEQNKWIYFKVNFITLTVPRQKDGDISGEVLQQLLHTWLVYARKYFYLHNYVWKVERGSKGKIHIHITSDTFIHYKKLRDSWNRIMQKKGLMNEYYSTHGHYDANSTDVHSVKSIKNLAGYLCKYMSKGTGLNEKYTKRIWGCNTMLSSSNKCSYIADLCEASEIMKPLFNKEIRYDLIKSKPDSLGNVKSVGEIFFMNAKSWHLLTGKLLAKVYNEHRWRIRNATPKPPDEYLVIGEVDSKVLQTVMKQKSEIIERLTEIEKPPPKVIQLSLLN